MGIKRKDELSFLDNMAVLTIYVAKNMKSSKVRDSARYITDKKFSTIQHGADVIVTRYM